MSEEEIKDIFNLICNYRALNYFGYNSSEIGYTALNEALSLIDKLQKKNENLNKKNKRYDKYLKNKDIEHEKVLEYIETEKERDYVSKDKIKAKMEELEERNKIFKLELPEDVTIYQYGIEVLEELLGG